MDPAPRWRAASEHPLAGQSVQHGGRVLRLRQWFRFVHIGFFHVLIGANILLTRPDWFCLLDCHDKHRVLMGEPTICTSLLWVLEILNRHYCLLQRGR